MVDSRRADILASSAFPLYFILNNPCLRPTYSTLEYSLGFTPLLSIPAADGPYCWASLLTASLRPLQNYPTFFYKSDFHKIPHSLHHFPSPVHQGRTSRAQISSSFLPDLHSQGRPSWWPQNTTFSLCSGCCPHPEHFLPLLCLYKADLTFQDQIRKDPASSRKVFLQF